MAATQRGEGGSICFRKLSAADLPKLEPLKHELPGFHHHVSIVNEETQQQWFSSLDDHPHSPRTLVLIAESSGTDVGIFKIVVDWVNRSADVGWDVFPEHRQNGHGTAIVSAGRDYCWNVLNLRRLTCEVLDNNSASIKCAERAGFVLEGLKRESVHRDGFYLDSRIYGLLLAP